MINLFKKFNSTATNKDDEVYALLEKFYNSFFDDMYNELNIEKYRPIRDAIGLVMIKFDSNDHPLAYTSKLVMYIQAKVAMNNLALTDEQQKMMQELNQKTNRVNLSYVYTSPLNDVSQFMPA